MNATDYQQFLQDYQTQQYQQQMQLYQQQCQEHKKLQEEYFANYNAKVEPGITGTSPEPGTTSSSPAPGTTATSTNSHSQSTPRPTTSQDIPDSHPTYIPATTCSRTHHLTTTTTSRLPPTPPPKPIPKTSQPNQASGTSNVVGRGGWMARTIALQGAMGMQMHSRVQYLMESNRAYSTTFTNNLESTKTRFVGGARIQHMNSNPVL